MNTSFPPEISEKHNFYELDYKEYFNNIHEGIIGFYIYDGSHNYDDQLENLFIAEKFFSDNCLIMIDDRNYQGVRKATYKFMSSSKNEYEIIVDKSTYSNRHMTFWNGILVLQRKR